MKIIKKNLNIWNKFIFVIGRRKIMNKIILIKRTLSGFFYSTGILFALYISMIMLKGNIVFNITGLVTISMSIFIPIALATFIFISTVNNVDKRFKIMKVFVLIVFAFYGILLVNILFYSRLHYIDASTISITEYLKWSANFVPFKTITKYIQSFINDSLSKQIIIQNILGNILLFAPIGILLPCIFQRLYRFKNFLIALTVILVSVEIVQLLTCSGSFDIDDVILNSIGAVLFYGLWNVNAIQKMLIKMYVLKSDRLSVK